MEGNGNLPKYHHSQLLVRGRGNLVVHRYVLLHVIRWEVSFSSSSQDMEEEWAGRDGGERE
jgi:hypothetical protein